MRPKTIGAFVIFMTVALIGFDVYLASDDIVGNTYSEQIRAWADEWWWLGHLIAAAMFFLAWHWFRNNATPGATPTNKQKLWTNFLLLLLSCAFGAAIAEMIGFY
jgi:hypothetical protein